MPRFYSALMIDLDGTLVDTLGDFEAVLEACLQEMALPQLPAGTVRQMVGKGSEHLIASTLALVVPDWPHLNESSQRQLQSSAWRLYQEHYPRHNGKHSSVYPGALEGLKALKQAEIPMACLTNKPLAFAQSLLEKKGLLSSFDHVFGGDSFEHKKPHPAPLIGACAAIGIPVSQALMVGDSSNDAFAARAAGCHVALVNYGYNHGQSVACVPHDHLISSLEELAGICGIATQG